MIVMRLMKGTLDFIYSTIFRAKKLKSGFKFTSDASSSKEATGSSKAAEEEDVKIEEEKEIPQK